MLTNFFGKSKPINFVVLFVVIVFYFGVSFSEIYKSSSEGLSQILYAAGLFGVALLYCFIFGFILSKNKLTLDNSYGFLLLATLFGLFPEVFRHIDTLLFNVVLLIFFRKILSFRTSKSFFEKLFDSGFWLAILFMIAPFSLIFGILIYLSVSLFQKTNYQTLLIPFVGFLVPLLMYFAYCFWFDITGDFYALFYWYSSYDISLYLSEPYRIPLIIVGILSVIALVFKTPKVFLVRGNYRKFWIVISFIFAISLLYLGLKNHRNGAELLVLFFPVSVMVANWIESISKKIIKEIVLASLLIVPLLFFIV